MADPAWEDPLDPTFAAERGGRWNPPGSFRTLYLNGDLNTARLQIERMLRGSPVRIEDLDDNAFVLVATSLPRAQTVADGVSPDGLRELGLPDEYPLDEEGAPIDRERCQAVGSVLHRRGLRGVWCRSAADDAGEGRELAWFPATRRSRARQVWNRPLPLGTWRDARGWSDIGLAMQTDPGP